MIDPERVLAPLQSRPPFSERLRDYESSEALASAIDDASSAVERSFRTLLRSDPGAPDADRLSALSARELPWERLVERLRERDLVSLELAGMAHELRAAAVRAQRGEPRAADADRALQVVERLRAEVSAPGERSVRDVAHHTVSGGALEEGKQAVPPPARWRSLLPVAAVLLLAVLLAALGWWLLAGDSDDAVATGREAFREERYAPAAAAFREAVHDEPGNITARLYLARSYRRLGRLPEAADELRRATELAPNDAGVRRELGHLFMDLNRAGSAVAQYQRAVELEPGSTAGWIGLIQAMRAAGHPETQRTLQRAPADVRAVLGGATPVDETEDTT